MSDTHSLTVLSMLKISYLILCSSIYINFSKRENKKSQRKEFYKKTLKYTWYNKRRKCEKLSTTK